MSAEYATFGLAPAMRAGGVLANGDYQAHRDFVDFIVDGRPLLYQLSDLDAVSPSPPTYRPRSLPHRYAVSCWKPTPRWRAAGTSSTAAPSARTSGAAP